MACVVRFAARLIFSGPLNVTYLIASLRALSRAPRFACDSTVCQRAMPALSRAPHVAPSAIQWRAPRASPETALCQRAPPALTRAPPAAPSALLWRAPRASRRLHDALTKSATSATSAAGRGVAGGVAKRSTYD